MYLFLLIYIYLCRTYFGFILKFKPQMCRRCQIPSLTVTKFLCVCVSNKSPRGLRAFQVVSVEMGGR
jgi:hypothetical protein